MGYGNTTNVMYGVRLTVEEARVLYDYMNGLGTVPKKKRDPWSRNEYAYYLLDEWYKEKVDYRYYACIKSDGADSRVNGMTFAIEDDDYFEHVFGVHMAARGYGGDDPIEKYIMNPRDPVVDKIWEETCVPILVGAGFGEREPEIIIVDQVD